jgi:SIR2-like domain
MKELIVVLGAGASYDLVVPENTTIRPEYRPPLTKHLFTEVSPLQDILEDYPGARSLASDISYRVKNGEPLESVLRSLRDSPEPHDRRRFPQIPLYLQHLFGAISENYTTEPVNYTRLVGALMASDFRRVAFVTTNYDLFLEKALTSVMGSTFNHLDAYIREPKWILIKLHGSVNWAWEIDGPDIAAGSQQMIFDTISRIPLYERIHGTGELTLVSSYLHRGGGDQLFYPAISVPVDDKYEYVCPREHVEALQDLMSSCPNLPW